MSKHSKSSANSGRLLGSANEDRSALLARGECLLQRLEKEAAAARAEARHAELQQLLANARNGDDRELKVWLNRHDSNLLENASELQSGNPLSASRSSQVLTETGDAEQANWDDYLPAARQRLLVRVKQLQIGADDTRLPPRSDHRPHSDLGWQEKRVRVDKPAHRSPSDSPQKPASKLTKKSESRSPADIAGLAKKFDSTELEQQQSQHKKLLWFSKLSGFSASILLHVGIVIVLALFTIQLPSPPASLAFESSEASNEAFELTEPISVAEPSQASESLPMPEMEVDLSQDLENISSTMADSLSKTMTSPSASLASAAMLAASSGNGSADAMKNASFFGAAAEGNCFCYVIDSSSSMKGGPWEAAKSELLRSLASLKTKQRFYIIFFNQDVEAIPMPGEREPAKRALYATQENVEHARRWVDTIRIAKGAPPSKAMERAVDLEPDAVYLLTDGVTKTDLPGFLREKNRTFDLINGEQVRVPIHAIAFYSQAGQQLMQQVATENKGQFIYVPDPAKQ